MNTQLKPKYTPQDFKSELEVKWCPGCGDHGILNSVQKAMPEVAEQMGYSHEEFTIVSGIGCSSRFPYYMKTYGFHGIHGRASAIATGVKVANPKLSVWQITGDGDALAIGGNHFIHAVRRNIDLNIILFNNEIYGLTKGQYSPTSKYGKITKTSPFGTIEEPFNPEQLVIGSRGTFFARSLDVELALTKDCLVEAAKHSGTSVVEVLQNCVIFNDKTHLAITDRAERADRTIVLKHGERMIFGKDKNKGLVLDGFELKVVTIGENGVKEDDILVHDAHENNSIVHTMLVNMAYPEYPVALGVIRAVKEGSYDKRLTEQIEEASKENKIKTMEELLNSGDTWEVE
ncbi:MAG: 2-oxoacid:ferredoxin oxidoreductase subunit beta [Rikenellaceae bacterium]|nr:2-oxoacid:ferredoxin oxidoreductase subunit beta [Rikenellaceae bacterium]